MLPKGGDLFWGNNNFAPDDPVDVENHFSFGNMISFTGEWSLFASVNATSADVHSRKDTENDDLWNRNHTALSSLELLYRSTPKEYNAMLRSNYSFGITTSKKKLKDNAHDPTKWSNPLESQLPNGKVFRASVITNCVDASHLCSAKHENILSVWRRSSD